MTKYMREERRKNPLVLYILPKMTRGLDFPFLRDYDKRNVPVHIRPYATVCLGRIVCGNKI